MKLPHNWLETNKVYIMLFMIFLLILLMTCMLRQRMTREGFSPGTYPSALTKNVLSDWYKSKEFSGLDDVTYAESSRNYPIFPADHIGTNNLRNWDRPMNGTCAPAGICTPLYQRLAKPGTTDPHPPPLESRHRVNYYTSSSGKQLN